MNKINIEYSLFKKIESPSKNKMCFYKNHFDKCCPYTNSLESSLDYPSLLEQPSKRAAYPMLGFF